MAVLKDVALEAGCSIRTANRVLKENGYASADVKERVLAAAKKVNYRPNRTAQSLKTRKSYEIMVASYSLEELHIEKIAGFENALRKSGYSVSILFSASKQWKYEYEKVSDIIDEIRYRNPAAVAVFRGKEVDEVHFAEQMNSQNIPYVIFDSPHNIDVNSVKIDRQQGVYEAILYLAAKGYKNIAYLGFQTDSSRVTGYERALAELQREPVFVPFADDSDMHDQFSAGRNAAKDFIKMNPKPDAVQAYTDVMALGFMAGLNDAGLRAPNDVAVVGFDDRRAASMSSPPLTTVAQPNLEVGEAAAEMLLDAIENPAKARKKISTVTIPTRLVVRESA
jgi:DNA-binding LacI/PurR family transcriptional regulator